MFEFRFAKELKNKKIKFQNQENIEPQEILLDNLARKKEAELGITEKKFEIPLSKKILKGFFVIIIILILALFFKTFQFQILENKKFVARAQENKFIIKGLESSRGVIYDSKGNQLVFNKPSFNLILNKSKLPKSDTDKKNVFKIVFQILKQNFENFEDLEEKINKSKEPTILVSENLEHHALILLETRITELPGFEIQRNLTRDYKEGKIFAHLIGYTGQIKTDERKNNPDVYSAFDYVGRDGIERSYEEFLRKNPGKLRVEEDAFGNVISKEIVSLPESGKSLALWLDSDLQKKIILELEKSLEAVGAKSAAAIALNPKNGGVMALVSLPGFDNNLFNKGSNPEVIKGVLEDPNHPLFNRVITGQYPTGSTIKPLTATGALEEKLISPLKKINCQGEIIIPHKYNPEITYKYKDWRVHGLTDMRKAIAESCNVYFYTIGGGYKEQEGLGPSRIKKYLELFGWGQKTQIDLPGENKGFIPSPEWKKENKKENWWDGDTYNLSIGQGDIAITLLQVANSFAAIANGGTLYKPKVVKEIIDKNKITEIFPEVIRKDFVNPESLQIVREGMRKAVTGEGSPQATSVLLNSLPIKAAAKTGTAEASKPDYYHNWITVFAPYDDPEIVLTIMVENVKESRVVTIPIAKAVLEWYFGENKDSYQK